MCDTCPAHIPGPGEVAGGALGLAVGAALTKNGRRVMFWGLAIPMFLGIIVYTLGWWLLPIALGVLALTVAALLAVRRLQRHAVIARPEPTHQMREQLAARGLRTIPAPVRLARPALPRGLSITRKRQALPAPARALPAAGWRCPGCGKSAAACSCGADRGVALPAAVVTGKVVSAPVRGKVVR